MDDPKVIVDAWAKFKSAILSVFNTLNALGAVVLAYALANPTAAQELVGLMPEQYRPLAPLAALLWFIIVQVAKVNSVKRAVAKA